ncbi:Ldh family oxidoreductase [Pandoraea communis]|uniref:Ldh family oxidoreductase n=1 Tax=Pandoraea communis TaxID=2508297 RepID=UPI003520D13D
MARPGGAWRRPIAVTLATPSPLKIMRLEIDEAKALVRQAALAAGANEQTATSLANATVAAERSGHRSMGFAHLPDYLEGFTSGRIAGAVQPDIHFPTPATIRVDANAGIAQLGFEVEVLSAGMTGANWSLDTPSFQQGERSPGVGLVHRRDRSGCPRPRPARPARGSGRAPVR